MLGRSVSAVCPFSHPHTFASAHTLISQQVYSKGVSSRIFPPCPSGRRFLAKSDSVSAGARSRTWRSLVPAYSKQFRLRQDKTVTETETETAIKQAISLSWPFLSRSTSKSFHRWNSSA